MTDPLRVHELGRNDGPTLVLLHGFTDSGLCWPDAVRRWRHDYRIVAPDARGHGDSPRFDAATSGSNRSADMVADLVSLLEALTRGGEALTRGGEALTRGGEALTRGGGALPLLVGHSMGAGIAGIVLASRPDLVCAAVLEDPPWHTQPPGDGQPLEEGTTQQWVQSFRDDLDAAVFRGRTELPLWPEIELRPWGLSKARLDPSLTGPEQIVRQTPWTDVAAAITQPTLLVTGGRDDEVLVGPLSRQRLADLGNHHIEVAVVPGAGHTVRRDDADAYHQIVDPWIAKQLTRGS
ncbi:MAG: alpha/beta fold hydrolase [Dermatophilaceae bacterium]